MAFAVVGGPRKEKVGRHHFSGGHLLEGVPAARLEDPENLRVELPFVCDVHADVLHPDDIKRTVWKGTGVPLRVLLEEAGIEPGAHWLLAEGADAAAMSRSIPMAKAMDDALVALL